MQAKAVHVVELEKLAVLPIEVAEPGHGEVMVKTKACGLCCWDSWLYRGVNAPGPMPYAIGHEGVGIIEKVGPGVTNVKPGDNVFCASGSNEMMAEYITLGADCVVKLPNQIDDWAKAVYEPNCCVVNLLYLTNIEPGDHVVLVGAGYMGLMCLQGIMRSTPAGRVTVFELREDRRKLAAQYNPYEVLDPESPEGLQVIEEIQAAGGADVCIDFGASQSGYELADSLTKEAGKLTIGTFHRGDVTFNGTKWHLGGLKVYNLAPMSNAHYTELLPRAYELIKRRVYEPEQFITHTARFDDLQALETIFRVSIDKTDGYMKGAILF